MASTAELRTPVDLDLRVWGMGADGQVFSQHARARNISGGGALLSGIQRDLKIGDTIGVQRGQQKARCKVVWTRNTMSVEGIRVGVQLLSKQDCPWTSLLAGTAEATSPSLPGHRRWERHKISVLIALHDQRTALPIRVTATDISASGCYVETNQPHPIGSALDADLWMGEKKISTRVIVRTSDPGLGMGIEFVGLQPVDQKKFQDYLKAINPWGRSIS
jgi:hypothetical protein